MRATYKAIEVTKPGEFATVMKPLVEPGPSQVRIRVEASGVCHSDAGTVEGSFPVSWPRCPWLWRPGLGGWSARRCRFPRRLLRLLRVLSKWRSRELS